MIRKSGIEKLIEEFIENKLKKGLRNY